VDRACILARHCATLPAGPAGQRTGDPASNGGAETLAEEEDMHLPLRARLARVLAASALLLGTVLPAVPALADVLPG